MKLLRLQADDVERHVAGVEKGLPVGFGMDLEEASRDSIAVVLFLHEPKDGHDRIHVVLHV